MILHFKGVFTGSQGDINSTYRMWYDARLRVDSPGRFRVTDANRGLPEDSNVRH